MTSRITEINDEDGTGLTLRVEGALYLADAEILESAYMALRAKQVRGIAIDLAATHFIDNNSASTLCRLRDLGAQLIGLHFFARRIIEAAAEETRPLE